MTSGDLLREDPCNVMIGCTPELWDREPRGRSYGNLSPSTAFPQHSVIGMGFFIHFFNFVKDVLESRANI